MTAANNNAITSSSSISINVAEAILELHKWLHMTGIDHNDEHTFIAAYCTKLQEIGLPVDRFFCGASVLHPLVLARAWKWVDDGSPITDISITRAQDAANESSWDDPPMRKYFVLLSS